MSNNSGDGAQPPGFYRDNQGTSRWWDGTAFTERTQNSGGPSAPPPPTPNKTPWYKRKLVWAIAAVVIIVIAVGGGSGGGDGDGDTENASDDTTSSQPSESNTAGPADPAEPAETKSSKPKKEPAPEPEPAAVPVQAADLLKAFENNELSADAQYKGKTLKISGVVNSIDTDLFDEDKYILMIGGGGDFEFLTVNCSDMSNDELATLETGQNVTVTGDFDDGGDLGVEVKDCKLA